MKRLLFTIISLVLITLAGTLAAHQYQRDIIITGTDGPYIDSRAYVTLNDAITAAAGNIKTIRIAEEEVVTALIIPYTITLEFVSAGSIANSGQLTINTPFIHSDARQIFTGDGDIDFASGSVVKSSWFSNLVKALDITSDDTLTMLITESETLASNAAVGNDVSLKWESEFLITSGGNTLSNMGDVEAGTYQIFSSGGNFDFAAGAVIKSSWFTDLRIGLTHISDDNVSMTILIDQDEILDDDITLDSDQYLDFKLGSVIIPDATSTLTVDSPKNIIAKSRQQIIDISTNDTDPLIFTNPGIVYAEWLGAADGGADDLAEIHTMFASQSQGVFVMAGSYTVSASITFAAQFAYSRIDGKTTGRITGNFTASIFEFSNGFAYSIITGFRLIENESVALGSKILNVPDGELWIGALIENSRFDGGHTQFYGRGNVVEFVNVTFGPSGIGPNEYKAYFKASNKNISFINCIFSGTSTYGIATGGGGNSNILIENAHTEMATDAFLFMEQSGVMHMDNSYAAFSPAADASLGTIYITNSDLNHSDIFVKTAGRLHDSGLILTSNNIYRDTVGGNPTVTDGNHFIEDENYIREIPLTNPEFEPTIDGTEVLEDVDFAIQTDWDVTGEVTKDGPNEWIEFTFGGGSLNGTLQQVRADQSSAAANTSTYYLEYTIAVTTIPNGDFALVITGDTGGNTEIPDIDITLPFTEGRHKISFLTDSDSAASGDFTITASEATATQGEFTMDNVTLKKVTDIVGWEKYGNYWPALMSPNGILSGVSLDVDDNTHIIGIASSAYAIYQMVKLKPLVTYRLDVTIYSGTSERGEVQIGYYIGAAYTGLRGFLPGNSAAAQNQIRVSLYFTLSTVEAAREKHIILLKQNSASGYFYNPKLYECADFSFTSDGLSLFSRYFDI